MKQILFNEYLIEQMKIKGLTCSSVYFKTGTKEDKFYDILNGYYVPVSKRIIERLASSFGLNFRELYDLALECRGNISGIFIRGEKLQPKVLKYELLRARAITLEEMSLKTGCSESFLNEIESGQKTLIAKSVLKKLSKGYGIPFGYILNYSKGFGVV